MKPLGSLSLALFATALLCAASASAAAAAAAASEAAPPPRPATTKSAPAPSPFVRRPAASECAPQPLASASERDLRCADASALDLRAVDLSAVDFDGGTRWPPRDRLPPSFDAARIMTLGKDPGLGVRALHASGVTGAGVTIAIVDQPLLLDHVEYAGRVVSYDEVSIRPATPAQMHGCALASLAVGKSVGVAPGADVVWVAAFAVDFTADGPKPNLLHKAAAVRRVVELNRALPPARRVRALALAKGWELDDPGGAALEAAVQEAMAAGIFVVSSSIDRHYGFAFQGLDRRPDGDPDDFASYGPGVFTADVFWKAPRPDDVAALYVPMDARTTASPAGTSDYVFYRQGGWSWAIPYLAGAYALAAQVDPAITPARFMEVARATGRTVDVTRAGQTKRLGPIFDAPALIAALRAARAPKPR